MLVRIFNTVRFLKPVQIYGRMFRRRPRRLVSELPWQTRSHARRWTTPIERESPQIGPGHFHFLNQERRIDTWNDPAIPKLWLYNLHYFESPATDLIRNWIMENPHLQLGQMVALRASA